MKKYELHTHTKYSKCSSLEPKILLETAKKKGINGLAITDHDTIKGAIEISKLNKDPNFEVIIGEEISTDKGHVIGLYLKEEIKPGKIERVISEIKKQNGLVILPHPYDIGILRGSKINLKKFKKDIDAIEGINGRINFKKFNLKAQRFAKKNNIPLVSGSDAHFSKEVGKCCIYLETNLRTAIKNNQIKISGTNKGSFLPKIKSSFLRIKSLF